MTVLTEPGIRNGAFASALHSGLLQEAIAAAPGIAEDGIDSHWPEVVNLAVLAALSGVTGSSDVLVEVMLNPGEPEVVRTRAFGMLLRRLAAVIDVPSAVPYGTATHQR